MKRSKYSESQIVGTLKEADSGVLFCRSRAEKTVEIRKIILPE
jgi:hypothetical protein